jgi:hypothetical protein
MSKKHNFSYDLSTLNTYTEEVGGELIRRAILEGETVKLVKVQPGIKYKEAINLLDSTLVVQDGACGWSPSGQTQFSQRIITACDYKVNESLCPRDLNQYYLGQLLNPGSYNESVPYETVITELKLAQISQSIENSIWGASSATTCFSGFKEIIENDSQVINVSAITPTSAITSTNALSQVDLLVEQIPDDITDRTDLVCFMSHQAYRKYLINFRNSNYFSLPVGDSYAEMKTFHPATNIMVHPVGGLKNSNMVVIAPAAYMVVGVDLMSDSEQMRMFYSVDFDEVRLRVNYKLGVQIAWTEFVVWNGLS